MIAIARQHNGFVSLEFQGLTPPNEFEYGWKKKKSEKKRGTIYWLAWWLLFTKLPFFLGGGVKNTKPNIENTEEMNGKLTNEQMKIAPFKFSFIFNEFTLFSSLNKFVSFLWIFFLYICFTIYGCKWWNNIIS